MACTLFYDCKRRREIETSARTRAWICKRVRKQQTVEAKLTTQGNASLRQEGEIKSRRKRQSKSLSHLVGCSLSDLCTVDASHRKKMQQLYTLDSEEEWCHERVLFPRLLDKRERALIRGGGTYSVCWKQGDLWDPLGGVYQQPNKRRSYQGFSANLVTRLKVFVISRFGSENVSSTISIVRHIGNQCQDHLAFWINAWNQSRRSISTPPSSLSCCLQATVQCHQY
jgi:hypothetical protein